MLPGGPVVVDASLVIKWIRIEASSDWARAFLLAGMPLLAPDQLDIECANVFWRMRRRREPGAPDPQIALDRLLAVKLHRHRADAALARAALRLAGRLDHPVYDCLYLALALEQAANLAIADLPFATAIRRSGVLPPDRLLTPPTPA